MDIKENNKERKTEGIQFRSEQTNYKIIKKNGRVNLELNVENTENIDTRKLFQAIENNFNLFVDK